MRASYPLITQGNIPHRERRRRHSRAWCAGVSKRCVRPLDRLPQPHHLTQPWLHAVVVNVRGRWEEMDPPESHWTKEMEEK